MTEEEARKKWCPMGRVLMDVRNNGVVTAAAAVNVGNDTKRRDIRTGCIASECMMWRWTGAQFGSMVGYCGLAGKP